MRANSKSAKFRAIFTVLYSAAIAAGIHQDDAMRQAAWQTPGYGRRFYSTRKRVGRARAFKRRPEIHCVIAGQKRNARKLLGTRK